MKTFKKISFVLILCSLSRMGYSQSDSLGLPGDNLDLEAVLFIFKNSTSVEDFEKKLNSASEKVNNLDLNNDGQVDYLRVVEYGKEDFRSIVIQAPVSKSESQDIAVIEVEKRGDKNAHLQIVGDETLYGKDYIIEPGEPASLSSSTKNNSKNTDDAYIFPSDAKKTSGNVTINVWAWPTVGYIYGPGYTYWSSPWYWGYYPGWYSPWTPYGYYHYRRGWVGYNYGYYGHHTRVYAIPHAHHYYYGRRTSSGYVQKTSANYGRRDARKNGSGNRMEQRQRSSDNNRDARKSSDQNNRVRNGSGNNRIQTGQRKETRIKENKSQNNRVQNNSNRHENNSQKRTPSNGNRNNSGSGRQQNGSGGGHRK